MFKNGQKRFNKIDQKPQILILKKASRAMILQKCVYLLLF